jgi:hypothetical protein
VDVVVGGNGPHCVCELGQHGPAEGVGDSGSVQRDHGHVLDGSAENDVAINHAMILTFLSN